MKRFVPFALALAALLAFSPNGLASKQVIGGTAIPITSAPWAVFIRQSVSGGALLCSGSILDSLHVVTAAHCVYDTSGVQASITSLSVRAGISNYNSPQAGDAEQDRGVSSLRIHPGYAGSGGVNPDDVAVLALSAPLDMSGPAVQAVALPATGAAYPAGAAAGIAGFGRETLTAPPDGSLNLLSTTIDQQGSCAGHSNTVIPADDAVALCAIPAATATACTGDSGSGLVTTSDPRTLVGVVSAGPAGCTAGGAAIETYVGAPEILTFIQGAAQPPVAPRKTATTAINLSWHGLLAPGTTLTCASTGWVGTPSLAYVFENSQNGQVLQQGSSPNLVLRPADVSATVFCSALATNDGGTAVISTGTTTAVAAAPTLTIGPISRLSAARGATVSLRLVLTTATALTGKFAACVAPPAAVAARACASQQVSDGGLRGYPLTLLLRVKRSAPAGTWKLAVTAAAGASTGHTIALLGIARG
jgi:hypothetical protein